MPVYNDPKAKEQYFAPRQDGELDLIEEVRSAMVAIGLGHNTATAYDTDPKIQTARMRNCNVQRFVLNQFWTLQLYSLPQNTEELRRLLFPEGDILQWLQTFKEQVLPFAAKNNLPRLI